MKLICCLLSVACLTVGEIATAMGDCPDTKATHVDANDVAQGAGHHCGISIVLFGIEIEIEGPTCYDTVFHYPAHNYCDGVANPGTACASRDPLPVTKETCHCGVSIFGVHVYLPICSCTESDGGTCPNAATQPCAIITRPR